MHPTHHVPVQLILSTQLRIKISLIKMIGAMDDDEEIDDKDEKAGGADELLRDFHYALKCQFMERGRNLRASCLMTENVVFSCIILKSIQIYLKIHLPFAHLNMTLFCCPALLPTRSAAEWSASCLRQCTATGLLFTRWFFAVQTTKATQFWNPSSSKVGISVG